MLNTIISNLEKVVGFENIIHERSQLLAYEQTTFATNSKVYAVIKPENSKQVQEILIIARQSNLTVYPISRGCNWGLGSKVPLNDQALLLDLSRMTQIHSFSEELGFIEVSPGVTFAQLSDFLKANKSEYFLSVIGGHPDSSVIGNTVERGDGLGPLGDRSQHVCSLEVVLSDGTIFKTGMTNFTTSDLGNCTKDPIGPALDGLFFQSNLGIITKMTVWLKKKSKEFVSGIVTYSNNQELEKALPQIRALQEQGIIQGNCLAIWNIYKVLAASQQHPDLDNMNGKRPIVLSDENLDRHLPRGLKNIRWFVTFALYAPTSKHMQANLRQVKKLLKADAKKLVLITKRMAWLGRIFSKPASLILGLDISRWLDTFYYKSVYLGNPSKLSVQSLYWRKTGSLPKQIDPDKDRCGLLWLCHLVPSLSTEFLVSNKITEEVCKKYGFEPNIAYLNTSERCYRMFIAIMYDRDEKGQDSHALNCQNELQARLDSAGFPYFRLGIQSMTSAYPNENNYHTIIQKLKNLFDPSDTIAPGKYDFRTADFSRLNCSNMAD